MKIIYSYYWGLTLLRRGFTFLEKGVHAFRKCQIIGLLGEGFTPLRNGFTFFKGGFTFI